MLPSRYQPLSLFSLASVRMIGVLTSPQSSHSLFPHLLLLLLLLLLLRVLLYCASAVAALVLALRFLPAPSCKLADAAAFVIFVVAEFAVANPLCNCCCGRCNCSSCILRCWYCCCSGCRNCCCISCLYSVIPSCWRSIRCCCWCSYSCRCCSCCCCRCCYLCGGHSVSGAALWLLQSVEDVAWLASTSANNRHWSVLVGRWASVADASPTSNQHRVSVSWWTPQSCRPASAHTLIALSIARADWPSSEAAWQRLYLAIIRGRSEVWGLTLQGANFNGWNRGWRQTKHISHTSLYTWKKLVPNIDSHRTYLNTS